MFYYRLTIRPKAERTLDRPEYREFTSPARAGDYVGTLMMRGANEVRVKRIRQADYIRFTRNAA